MDDHELLRYSRQIMLPEIEIDGQERINQSHALIIGLGGLGAPVAMYLAAAGVGRLTLVDFDDVDLSNLQRQIIHGEDDINSAKVDSAKRFITRLNSLVDVHTINRKLTQPELQTLLTDVDVVIDASDNFSTRFDTNLSCVRSRTALVSGAAIRLEGQLVVYDPEVTDSPCYQCLYNGAEEGNLNCAENGVAAPVVGVIGSLQAVEALKIIGKFGTSLAGYLMVYDAKVTEWRKLKLPRNPNCPACGELQDLKGVTGL